LEKLSRALQQERTELQNTIKKLAAATLSPTVSSGVGVKSDSDSLRVNTPQEASNCQQVISESPLTSSPQITTTNACDVDQDSLAALAINGNSNDDEHNQRKEETNDQYQKLTTNDNDDCLLPSSSDTDVIAGSPNLYDCEFGQVAKTVD